MSATFVNAAFISYLLSAVAYAANISARKRLLTVAATALFVLGLTVNTLAVIFRWIEAGRPPFSNMYESLVCFAWAIALVYIVLEQVYKTRVAGFLTALLAVAAIAGASFFDTSVEPLVPALQSNWLTYHVITCFIGYAAFAISFAVSCIFVVQSYHSVSTENLDVMSYQMVRFGWLFLTIGILTGAIWADQAWGTYWSWDPKETWSLITWIIYAIFLHFRYVSGRFGVKNLAMFHAVCSIVGFLAVIFTYFGVNFVLSGLHSYT